MALPSRSMHTPLVHTQLRPLHRLWDMGTGQLKAMLEGHSGQVNSVAISPDGLTCVSGSDKTVRYIHFMLCPRSLLCAWWCVALPCCSMTRTHTPLAHTPLHPLHRLWDMGTGQLKAILEGHSNYVRSVAISPDSLTCVSGSEDKTVRCVCGAV